MSTAIAIFVKTPGLSPLKTRLAKGVGEENAMAFYHLSLKAIEKVIQQSKAQGYWAVGEKEGLENRLWQSLTHLHTGDGDLGQRQHHIYETLLKEHDKVLLIGADAPQITPNLINEAMKTLENNGFVIGPTHDGGYYLFGGTKPLEQSVWNNVTWSVETTREELEEKLPEQSHHLKLLTDVDEKEDLDAACNEMPENLNKAQQELLNWVQAL